MRILRDINAITNMGRQFFRVRFLKYVEIDTIASEGPSDIVDAYAPIVHFAIYARVKRLGDNVAVHAMTHLGVQFRSVAGRIPSFRTGYHWPLNGTGNE